MQLKPVPLAFLSLFGLSSHSAVAQDVTAISTIVVTANKIEKPLSETNGSVAVITSEAMTREGATELYDALNHEPGISVSGGAGRPQNITIRGMSGNRVAVIKDGVRVADGYGADDLNDVAGHNSFDLGDVKQIEVVKGAGSSLYGSGAVGGVVVLTSKAPSDYLGQRDSYWGIEGGYAGISNKYRTTLTTAQRFGDSDHLLRLSYWTGSESKNHDESLYLRDVDGFHAALTSEWFVSPQWMLKGKLSYYQQEALREEGQPPIQQDGKGWIAKDFHEQGQVTTLESRVGAEWEGAGILADQADFNLYYRLTENDSDLRVAMERVQESLLFKRRQIDSRQFRDALMGGSAEMQKQVSLGSANHTFAWGVTLESTRHERPLEKQIIDWNGAQRTESAPFAEATTDRFGVYVHDDIAWGRWNLTPGLRFDYQRLSPGGADSIGTEALGRYALESTDHSEISPSLSLAYQWTDALNTYLSYTHGFRAPSYAKAYGFVPHLNGDLGSFVILPNPDLGAETSDNFELGSKYDDGRLAVYGALFYSVFDDFIDEQVVGWDDANQHAIVQYQNLNGVKTYGAELTVRYALTDALAISSKLGIVDGEDEQGEEIRALTPLEGNTQLDYLAEDWDGFVRANYAGAMARVPTCYGELGMAETCAETSGWLTVDLGAGYFVTPDFRLNLAIHNLLDRDYTRYQDVAGVAAKDTTFSSQPGRYFNINAKYSF